MLSVELVILVLCLSSLRRTLCEHHCDRGICLRVERSRATSWNEARDRCAAWRNGTGAVLLEIYDDRYELVALDAFRKFQLAGLRVPFGLAYEEGRFRWLSSIDRSTSFYSEHLRGLSESCKTFVVLDREDSIKVEAVCGYVALNHTLVCMKDNTLNSSADDVHSSRNSSSSSSSSSSAMLAALGFVGVLMLAIVLSLVAGMIRMQRPRKPVRGERRMSNPRVLSFYRYDRSCPSPVVHADAPFQKGNPETGAKSLEFDTRGSPHSTLATGGVYCVPRPFRDGLNETI